MTPDEQLERARTAYERARLRKGLRLAALVLPMVVASLRGCGGRSATLLIATSLALLVITLVWRGGSAARAVVPGYVAGCVPLAVALLACPACETLGLGGPAPLVACIAGGLASGAIVVRFSAQERTDRFAFVAAGGTVAALAGSLGCLAVGLGGVVAMAAGLLVVAPFALRGAATR